LTEEGELAISGIGRKRETARVWALSMLCQGKDKDLY